MIGTAYLDESADATQSEVFVAAGFYCVDEFWKILRRKLGSWRVKSAATSNDSLRAIMDGF
jgi:hypothetical protein